MPNKYNIEFRGAPAAEVAQSMRVLYLASVRDNKRCDGDPFAETVAGASNIFGHVTVAVGDDLHTPKLGCDGAYHLGDEWWERSYTALAEALGIEISPVLDTAIQDFKRRASSREINIELMRWKNLQAEVDLEATADLDIVDEVSDPSTEEMDTEKASNVVEVLLASNEQFKTAVEEDAHSWLAKRKLHSAEAFAEEVDFFRREAIAILTGAQRLGINAIIYPGEGLESVRVGAEILGINLQWYPIQITKKKGPAHSIASVMDPDAFRKLTAAVTAEVTATVTKTVTKQVMQSVASQFAGTAVADTACIATPSAALLPFFAGRAATSSPVPKEKLDDPTRALMEWALSRLFLCADTAMQLEVINASAARTRSSGLITPDVLHLKAWLSLLCVASHEGGAAPRDSKPPETRPNTPQTPRCGM